ncbi:MAG TPA: endolytic transglycosylase MltG [Sphingomicrobium sp.]|nr:endolytic transglycosylase MltG [Sphingomicrobium sp.]
MKRPGRLAAIAIAIVGLWFLASWWGPGAIKKDADFVVPPGASLGAVADKLEKERVIGSASAFTWRAKIFGGGDPIKAGEFLLPKGSSRATILDIIQHGKPIRRLVTVPEGMPSIMVYDRLRAEPLLTGPVAVPAEGSVLPESYDFERGEPRAAVLARMQAAMTRTVKTLWAKRKAGLCPIATPEQAVTLAAIVEKETAKPAERPIVAGVYCNRLRLGMKLDADPTVIYPITKGKPLGRRILKSELDAITGYNTYREAGLPAGPITNPGRASIAAVLNPAQTDYLYFVADGTGGHAFARTLAEQEANKAKWFAIRRARGEM